VHVSAAAITADDKPFKTLDEALAKSGRKDPTLLDAKSRETVEAQEQFSASDIAEIRRSEKATQGLGKNR
jgi:DNA-binding transcriptional regulator YiaG